VKKCVYLNSAATSFPKPERVLQRVISFIQKPPFHQARAGLEDETVNIVSDCRKELAVLFNVPEPDRLIFTSGATESLNLAFRGLPLAGKHIITTVVEHNSVLRPLKTMERDGLIELDTVACDTNGLVPPESIENAIKPDTFAIVVNHCSNVTGMINDIGAIGQLTKQKNITFIVDASQSAGVYPIDVEQMNIDILVFTGHKSLFGLQGIGGAYIREGINLKPLKIGGTGVRSDYLFQPETVPMFFEAGTLNLPGIVSLNEGVRYIREKGMTNIRKRKEEIVLRLMESLSQYEEVLLYPEKSHRTSLFSFNVAGMEAADIGYMLENNFGIITRSGLHCAPLIHKYIGTFTEGSLRVSPSSFTTDKEIKYFISAIDQIVKKVESK